VVTKEETRLSRWERTSEVPLLLLALAFLVAYAWPVLDPRLDPGLENVLTIASWTVWTAFAVDFIMRLILAERRSSYALRHWYDVLMLVAPMLRPLRLLRLLAFARILNRSAVGGLAGRVSVYVGGVSIMSVGLGALAILDVERGAPNANIQTPGDALWWACTTVTAVGYGDRYPVTTAGRLIAVALMMVGIAAVGSLTAIIAAWLIENIQQPEESDDNESA
jgi:voltage-gated potassium channel